jgi:hypothetical protein
VVQPGLWAKVEVEQQLMAIDLSTPPDIQHMLEAPAQAPSLEFQP